MANTITVDPFPSGSEITSSLRIINGSIALSGSATSSGEVLDWLDLDINLQASPVSLKVWSENASGYVYQYISSTNALFVMVQGAAAGDPLAPQTTGNYPAGVTGDVIRFEAKFTKGL